MNVFADKRPFMGQDPHVTPYQGEYLLVQSAYNDRRIVIKAFKDLKEMKRNQSQTVWIGKEQQVWAPELHQILGKWYIYFAASDGYNPNHRSYVLESDCPFGPYHSLGKVITPNNEDIWAIDMTIFHHNNKSYAVWSGWETNHAEFPQHLYIAPLEEPNRIGTRILLSSPHFNWEKSIAPILEGPQILDNNGRLFISYSANASWTPQYSVGLLEHNGGPILDPTSWDKYPLPFLTGGGHGCFVENNYYYHRKLSLEYGWADREITSTPFHWKEGHPKLGK